MRIRMLIVSSFIKRRSDMVHARIQEFSSGVCVCVCGGGGGGGSRSRSIWHIKKALTTYFLFYFFSPQLILQKSSGYFQRKLLFAKVPVGMEFFSRGGGGGRGSNYLQGGPIAFSQ